MGWDIQWIPPRRVASKANGGYAYTIWQQKGERIFLFLFWYILVNFWLLFLGRGGRCFNVQLHQSRIGENPKRRCQMLRQLNAVVESEQSPILNQDPDNHSQKAWRRHEDIILDGGSFGCQHYPLIQVITTSTTDCNLKRPKFLGFHWFRFHFSLRFDGIHYDRCVDTATGALPLKLDAQVEYPKMEMIWQVC